ncbi:MAG TPA: hypothetical protein VMR14_05430 [Streptosporangiaceae bacterium]|jgi:hypothetical protein|nr:hypothetical protein [Streptosporangiaceae bacterium]
MIISAALCPAAPLLIPELNGAEPVLPELRQAARSAAGELVAADPGLLVVAGTGASTATWDRPARADLAAFAPGIDPGLTKADEAADEAGEQAGAGRAWASVLAVPARSGYEHGHERPGSLLVGNWLLDSVGYAGERLLTSVAMDEPAASCARIGAELAGLADRVALLVLADGSACRGSKAPGYLDHRSTGFDAAVERAVRTGDLGALLAIDAGLAAELKATGRAAWQLMAGALDGAGVASVVRYCDDPLGVAYLVASLRVAGVG